MDDLIRAAGFGIDVIARGYIIMTGQNITHGIELSHHTRSAAKPRNTTLSQVVYFHVM
jgi:hypothetical protein